MKTKSNFIQSFDAPQKKISSLMGGTLRNSLEQKREALTELIELILFLGKRGCPLRGHSDYGELQFSNLSIKNEGLFRDLIKLLVNSGNSKLKKHFNSAPKNATYISSNFQNQILKIIGDVMQKNIKNEIVENKFYAIPVDETQDISKKEQLTFTIRYYFRGHIKERLLGMYDANLIFEYKKESTQNIYGFGI